MYTMKLLAVVIFLCLLSGCEIIRPRPVTAFPNCKRVKKGDIVHANGFWVAEYEFQWLIRKASEK